MNLKQMGERAADARRGKPGTGRKLRSGKALRAIEKAKTRGENQLGGCVDYWIDLLAGKFPEATHTDRIRASENLSNRCGLPIRSEGTMPLNLKIKTVEVRGWVDRDGVLHEEPPEVRPEVPPARPS